MTYLGSRSWQYELFESLRHSKNRRTAGLVEAKIYGDMTDEEIGAQWAVLGCGDKPCTLVNVKSHWGDIERVRDGEMPKPRGHQVRDTGWILMQALRNPGASAQFRETAETYYRRVYEVDRIAIRADWRDWEVTSRRSGR